MDLQVGIVGISGRTFVSLGLGTFGAILILYAVVKWRTPKLNGFRARHSNLPNPDSPDIGPAERIFARLLAVLIAIIGLIFIGLALV